MGTTEFEGRNYQIVRVRNYKRGSYGILEIRASTLDAVTPAIEEIKARYPENPYQTRVSAVIFDPDSKKYIVQATHWGAD